MIQLVSSATKDHPDNHKLEKKSSGDISPVECRRKCTDVAMLLLLVCSWAAMTGEIQHSIPYSLREFIEQKGEIGLINSEHQFNEDVLFTFLP